MSKTGVYPLHYQILRSDLKSLIELINSVEGESRIMMEHTVRYYEVLAHQLSEANLFVSANIRLTCR